MRYSICVSGASGGKTIEPAKEFAIRTGEAIAKAGHVITTGATLGIPYYAAKAVKEKGGMSIGFSPAASLREHVKKYRLPIGIFDFVNFTGMNYVGRDIQLVLSSDAIITIGGRFGSLHEFTTAMESHMPCGVLLGSGGTADFVPEIMKHLEPINKDMLVLDDNPERLVKRIIDILDEDNKDINTDALVSCWYLDDDCDEFGNHISKSGKRKR